MAEIRVVTADYQRLVVTYSTQDDTVYLLCPPGQDPVTVLGAARLVLPDNRYQELACYLCGAAESAGYGTGPDRVSRAPRLWGYRAAGPPALRRRSDSTRAATCRLSSGDSSSMLAMSRSRSWSPDTGPPGPRPGAASS